MDAVRTLRMTFLLLALAAPVAGQAFGQIVDPNPPIACDEGAEEDGGSYIEFSGTWTSPGGTVRGRLEWDDVMGWFDRLKDFFGGGNKPPEGGENPPRTAARTRPRAARTLRTVAKPRPTAVRRPRTAVRRPPTAARPRPRAAAGAAMRVGRNPAPRPAARWCCKSSTTPA